MPHPSDLVEGSPNDVIRVSNPTAEDITVEWGLTPHTLKAGVTEMYTRPIGEHICKHLTDREIKASGREADMLKLSLRKEWRDKIIIGVVTRGVQQAPSVSPGEAAQAEQEAMRVRQADKIAELERELAVAKAKEANSENSTETPKIDIEVESTKNEDAPKEEAPSKMTWPEFSKMHKDKGTPREEVSALWKEYKNA